MDFAKRFIGNAPLGDSALELRVLNSAANLIHTAAAWRWSVGALAAEAVVNDQKDYDFTDPTDLLYLLPSKLIYSDGHLDVLNPIAVIANETTTKGVPNQISLVDADTFRIFPTPSGLSSPLPNIYVLYKKKNTVITAGNKGTAATLLFPDEWFFVFEQACLVFAYNFINDPRGGNVGFSQGQASYSGQWGVVMGLIGYMIEREKPFIVDGAVGL